MKKMIHKARKGVFIIAVAMMASTYSYAQSIDQERMDRDLKVTWESLHERSNDPQRIQDERVLVEDQAQYPTSTQQFLENSCGQVHLHSFSIAKARYRKGFAPWHFP